MTSVTITYDYVYYGSGAGRTRRPRSSTGPGGFTAIPGINQLPGGTIDTGNTQPATIVVGPVTYQFAFMSVSGGTPAGQTTPSGVTSFVATAPPPPVKVGTAPIVVLVVYIPVGGGGNGSGSGAVIDSFNNTTGQLFNDIFVSVSPDPGGPPPPLTTSGNDAGYVDTTNATETITALSPTSPTDVVFEEWMNFYPQGATTVQITGAELTVNKGTSAYALAFYKAKVDPCAAIRQELEDLSRGDFISQAAYEAARLHITELLVQCEKANGE
jgi:hypothetical protein